MLATMIQPTQQETVRSAAQRARSMKGKHLSPEMIDRLTELAADSTYIYVVPSATSLQRDINFFRSFRSELKFWDRKGEPFEFDDSARPICRKETFMAILYNERTTEARVYVFFGYEKFC